MDRTEVSVVEDDTKRYISFGPVVNPDGTPTDFTREMFGIPVAPRELTKIELRAKIAKLKRARRTLCEVAGGLPRIMDDDLRNASLIAFEIQEALEEMLNGPKR
jgi:hypothetical protein